MIFITEFVPLVHADSLPRLATNTMEIVAKYAN